MSLLKDVRLILIIALAVMCLVALKLCSTEYSSGVATQAADSSNAESQGSAKVQASDSDVAGIATDVAEKPEADELVVADEQSADEATAGAESIADDATAGPASEESVEATENAVDAVVETAVENNDEATVEAAVEEVPEVSAEASAEAATEDASLDDPVVAETEAESADSTSVESVAETAEVVVADDAVTDQAPATAAEVAATEDPDATGEVATGGNLSALGIPKSESISVEALELGEKSATGELLTDFKADIETVREGLKGYSQKLDSAQSLFDSVSGIKK